MNENRRYRICRACFSPSETLEGIRIEDEMLFEDLVRPAVGSLETVFPTSHYDVFNVARFSIPWVKGKPPSRSHRER